MRRVEVVIDELILRGDLSPAQARAIATGVESRLTALAEAHEGSLRGRAETFRRLEPVAASRDTLGDSIAGAVWEAIA